MSSKRRWCWRELYWPRPLKWTVVQQLMHRLVADPGLGPLVIETRATNETIRFQIAADVRCIRVVESLLGELVPGMQTVTAGVRRAVIRAARLKVTHPLLALDTSRIEAVTRALLAGLSGLRTGEQLVLQLFIGGRVAPMLSRRPPLEARQSWWSLLNHGAQAASGDELARVRERRRQHGALVSVRLGAEAATPRKARALIQRLFGALCTIEAAGVRLRLWPEDPAKLHQVRRPWGYGMQLSSTEIASLTGWPVGEGDLPGLPPVSPRQIAPPNWLAGMHQRLVGRVFAHSSAPGKPVALGIPPRDALLHTVLLGPTGAGKSTALEHLALADITAGRGVALTDTLSKQWQPLLELVASLPHDLTTHDRGIALSHLPHRVKFTSLTLAQRAEVARLYAIGVSVPDICARFNVTKNTVIRLRKQAGVPQRERGLNEPQGDEAEVMYASGKSLLTIAKHFSTGVGAVRGCLLRRGVRMRRRNGG